MITICTRWETSQMPPELEWRMWNQLKGAFDIGEFYFSPIIDSMKKCDLSQFSTLEECIEKAKGLKIFLEHEGKKDLKKMSNIPLDQDVVFILSNTNLKNKHLITDLDMSLKINVKNERCELYGINDAAIALSYRYNL